MPVFVSELLGQLKNIWAQLSGGQRVSVAAVLAATVVGMLSLAYYATRPDYVAFGNAIEGADRQRVVAALEEKSIDYRVENGTILVNGSQKSDAEKALDAAGLRGDGAAEETSGSGMLEDRAQRQWRLQLKKVRRIERSIRKMEGVTYVQVNPHAAERSQFLRKKGSGRASVIVRFIHAASFRRMAGEIRKVVASSLGLDPKMVEVVSSDGQSLSDTAVSAGAGFSPLLELQSRHAADLTLKARGLLEKVYPGKTYVAVAVEYDNKIVESQEDIVSADKIVQQETSYKTKDSTGSAASGDPNGTGATGGASSANSFTAAPKNSSVTQVDKKYHPITGKKTTRPLGPDLKQISVALSIDESLSSKKTEIENLIKGVIGWSSGRDREITASIAKFEELEEAPVTGATIEMLREWAPLAGQILSVVFVLFFLKGLLKRNRSPSLATSAGGARGVAGAQDAAEEDPAKAAIRLRREIEKAVAQDPASVSRLLESWLATKEPA